MSKPTNPLLDALIDRLTPDQIVTLLTSVVGTPAETESAPPPKVGARHATPATLPTRGPLRRKAQAAQTRYVPVKRGKAGAAAAARLNATDSAVYAALLANPAGLSRRELLAASKVVSIHAVDGAVWRLQKNHGLVVAKPY